MNIAAVMDELADRLRGIDGLRVAAWPATSVTPPAAVVLLPRTYRYDETYGRGTDRLTIPVAVLVGRVDERAARDILAAYLDGAGASSVKAVVEAGTPSSFDTVRVTGVDIDVMTMGSVDYWGAVFELDILGPGSS